MTAEPPDESLFASLPALSTPLHILIVDDEVPFALVMESHLRELQEAFPRAVIEVVHDWSEAILAVHSDPPPSVTILDLRMPAGRGEPFVELREAVRRAIEFEDRTAVVIVTGHGKADVEALLVDSKIEVLHKDPSLWNPGNIIRAIVRALERRSLADEKGRFAQLRGIIKELRDRGYADATSKKI